MLPKFSIFAAPPRKIQLRALSTTFALLGVAATATPGAWAALDRIPGGYPDNRDNEWSSGQKVGATFRLTWKTPQKIDRIALYDRPNDNDNATKSLLTFSDGTTIEVGPLPNDGKTPAEVRFGAKTVTWVEWKALAISDNTLNIGLGEFAVFLAY